VVQGPPGVACCVVGVETPAQFAEIATAWREMRPLHWPELARDADAWDPRRWPGRLRPRETGPVDGSPIGPRFTHRILCWPGAGVRY
jgi:hypothetical protein